MFNSSFFVPIGSSNVTTDVLFGGGATTYGGISVGGFFPLNNSGDLNFSFNTGKGINSGGTVLYLLKSSYGGYYFAGSNISTYQGIACGNVGRLNIDGSLDQSFNTAGKFTGDVYTLTEDSSGNIYIGGAFTNYDSTGRARLIKLNRSGVLDTSFNPTVSNGIVYTMVIDPNGKIYVGGSFTTVNSATNNCLIRLNTNGTKDEAFNNTTGFNGQVRAIKISSNDRIYVGGFFTTWKSQNYRALIRLNTDGGADSAFATALKFTASPASPSIWNIDEDDAGNVYAAGNFLTYDSNSIRGLCKLDSSANFVAFLSNPTSIPQSFASLRTSENQFYISANNGLHFISATGAPVSGFVSQVFSGAPFGICLI